MRDKLITLITVLGEDRDSSGFKKGELTQKVEVFAEEKSVSWTEYYEALRSAMEVSCIFSVDPDDFLLSVAEISLQDGIRKVKASRVEYEGTVYNIVRTYKAPGSGRLELTCKEVE